MLERAGPVIEVELEGARLERRVLDPLLGTSGSSAEALVRAAYLRFGTGAFLRLSGRFAVTLRDVERGLVVLARDPSGAVPLYLHRAAGGHLAATDVEVVRARAGRSLDEERLAAWLEHGLWADPVKTAFGGVEVVPPGTTAVIDVARGGRTRRAPFWSFSPLGVPRELSPVQASAELERALTRVIDEAGLGEGTALAGDPLPVAAIARSSPLRAGGLGLAGPLPDPDDEVLVRAARAAAHPLPRSALVRLAQLESLAASGHDVATALGAREVLGGNETTLAAFVRGLAGLLEATPSVASARALVQLGLPMDRALHDHLLGREAKGAVLRVLRRWSRQLPPEVAARVQERVPEPAHDAGLELVPQATGDPFTDRRFAEVKDPAMAAEHAGAVRLAAGHGRAVVAPFLEPAVVETAFSLPVATLIGGGLWMRVIGGEPYTSGPGAAAAREDRARGLVLFRRAFAG